MRKDSLLKLRQLVDDLSDRDEQLKRDVAAFNDFFEHFPVPVTVWSTNRNGDVLTCKGNAIPCIDSSCIEKMFACPHLTDHIIQAHEKARDGQTISFMIESGDPIFYVHVVPKLDALDNFAGAMGLAWDITSNVAMLGHASNSLMHYKNGDADAGLDLLKEAVASSRLRTMIESGIPMHRMPDNEEL